MNLWLAAVLVVVLVATAGLLSVVEVVLLHVSAARAATLGDGDESWGDELVDLLQHRESTLSAVLLLRLLAQVAAVGLVLAALADGGGVLRWAVVTALIVAALGGAEALAKTAALVRTDQMAQRVTPLARAIGRIPLLGLLGRALSSTVRRRTPGTDDTEQPRVSEEELLAYAEVAVEAEVIESEERALIESIIEFGDTIVREVMVPRPDMVSVDAEWQVSDVMEIVILNGFSRIPVVGEGIDDVIGIAYAKDLMRAERDGNGAHAVRSHIRQARFVPEQQRVSMLLREMQSEQFHMAVVIDEYGGVAGLVTLEDLIEELVGEIVDEFDVEDPMAEPLPGGAYRVNARMPLDEVNDLLDADLPEGDWDTVGGLLFGSLGHVPTEGESIELDTHRLTAARVQGRRIGEVRIDRLGGPDTLATRGSEARATKRER